MENNSKNYLSSSSSKPMKTLGHLVNKLFKHTKKQSSTTSVLSHEVNNLIHVPISEPLAEDQLLVNSPPISQGCSNSKNEDKSSETNTKDNENWVVAEKYQIKNVLEETEEFTFDIMLTEKRDIRQQFTVEQLPKFCEKLHDLIEIVRKIQADSTSFTEYPRQLQMDLQKEAKELDLLYLEIRCIQTTIDMVRNQREIIKNGKNEAIEQLKKLEAEEIREIERSINIRDIPLFKSWEKTKRCRTPESYERLLNDVRRNQEALKNLEILVQRRKTKLSFVNQPRRESNLVNAIVNALPQNSIDDTNNEELK